MYIKLSFHRLQKMSGRNPLLYCTFTLINHHAGIPKHNNYKRNNKLGYSLFVTLGLGSAFSGVRSGKRLYVSE